MSELIRESLDLIAFELRRNQVQVATDCPTAIPRIFADRIRVQQVLVNLLLNSTEALGEQDSDDLRIRLKCSSADGFVRVAVTDNGPDFGPEDQARLFQPFYSTKPQGLGMGLAVNRQIIENYGGRIWVTNIEGSAAFRFSLPIEGVDNHGQATNGLHR